MHGGVVDGGLAFPQVVHQQVPDGPALDVVPVDQLLAAELALRSQRPGRRHLVCQDAGSSQQLVEVRAAGTVAVLQVLGDPQQLQAVADGDVSDQAAFGRQDGRDPALRQLRGVAVDAVRLADRG